MLCVNFIHEWRDLQFKVDSERQIFEKFFMAILFALSILAKFCREKIAEEVLFVFCYDVWPSVRTLALSLINQRTTY